MSGHDAAAVWEPSPERAASSQMATFARYLRATDPSYGGDDLDYHALWQWSVADVGRFWSHIWNFYGVDSASSVGAALQSTSVEDARWFADASVNYAQQALSHDIDGAEPAVLFYTEHDREPRVSLSWDELRQQVAAFSTNLRKWGVEPGDRVVGYLPPSVPTVVAMLSAAAVGATWAQCGLDFGSSAAIDRLAQLEPSVLILADGYSYNGKGFDRTAEGMTIDAALSTVHTTITVSLTDAAWPEPASDHTFVSYGAAIQSPGARLTFTSVPFDHPLWVLFSSGTTGKPKGIVHGHGGVLLAHLVLLGQHLDIGADDRFSWYSSTNWMMWNIVVSGLLMGASIVVYDGSPSYPRTDRFWEFCADASITVTGTSPAYLRACENAGGTPGTDHDLSCLRTIGVTGSPVPRSCFEWTRDAVGASIQLASSSGGTDVVSAFAAANPLTPVWSAELSAPCLGVALEAWDEGGRPVHNQVGELVVRRPIPSMPVGLWGDDDHSKLHELYFSTYPGVWRHGDWITLTDRGSVVIHGRSDATLNRKGVRLGSAEIYDAVEELPAVAEALVIGVEGNDAEYWMPMFVALAPGAVMTPELRRTVIDAITRATSKRHVPDDIIVVDAIPHTMTGKKLEVPIKRILLGANPDDVFNSAAVDNPDAVRAFCRFARMSAEGGNS